MFEKIKYYFEKGYYNEKHLAVFLGKGVITQNEYDELLKG